MEQARIVPPLPRSMKPATMCKIVQHVHGVPGVDFPTVFDISPVNYPYVVNDTNMQLIPWKRVIPLLFEKVEVENDYQVRARQDLICNLKKTKLLSSKLSSEREVKHEIEKFFNIQPEDYKKFDPWGIWKSRINKVARMWHYWLIPTKWKKVLKSQKEFLDVEYESGEEGEACDVGLPLSPPVPPAMSASVSTPVSPRIPSPTHHPMPYEGKHAPSKRKRSKEVVTEIRDPTFKTLLHNEWKANCNPPAHSPSFHQFLLKLGASGLSLDWNQVPKSVRDSLSPGELCEFIQWLVHPGQQATESRHIKFDPERPGIPTFPTTSIENNKLHPTYLNWARAIRILNDFQKSSKYNPLIQRIVSLLWGKLNRAGFLNNPTTDQGKLPALVHFFEADRASTFVHAMRHSELQQWLLQFQNFLEHPQAIFMSPPKPLEPPTSTRQNPRRQTTPQANRERKRSLSPADSDQGPSPSTTPEEKEKPSVREPLREHLREPLRTNDLFSFRVKLPSQEEVLVPFFVTEIKGKDLRGALEVPKTGDIIGLEMFQPKTNETTSYKRDALTVKATSARPIAEVTVSLP